MKKLITLLALIITITINAQAPQGFNYQATVRNSAGTLITNQNVMFKFNIMLNSQTSLPIYSETHQAPTDDLGQVNLTVGMGTPTIGSFTSINWANGTYYLGIELNTGSGYVVMGTTQLLSVPFALYANSAGSITSNSNSFNHHVGEFYGGGIIASVWKVNGIEHGLIVSLNDLSTAIPWTTPTYQNLTVGASAQSNTDGFTNTNAIIAQAGLSTNYAAGLCKSFNAGGFNDWYLPAFWELQQIFFSKQIINELIGNTNGISEINNYWSSSESVDYENAGIIHAKNLRMLDGGLSWDNYNKGMLFRVRAVRRF